METDDYVEKQTMKDIEQLEDIPVPHFGWVMTHQEKLEAATLLSLLTGSPSTSADRKQP